MESDLLPFTMTFDSKVNVVYIYNRGRRSQKGVVVKTVEVDDVDKNGGVYLDYDKDGKIFGIEILSPKNVTLLEVLKLFSEKENGL